MQNTTDPAPRSAAKIALYWIVVGIPLAWGITMTVLKAAAMFK